MTPATATTEKTARLTEQFLEVRRQSEQLCLPLTPEDMMVNADLAMYDAKEAGRDQIAVYEPGEHAQGHMRGRVTWAERISSASRSASWR